MKYGTLEFTPVAQSSELVAQTLFDQVMLASLGEKLLVAPINPELADTEAFCKEYDIGLDASANCIIVQAKRADKVWFAAVVVLATDRADVNKTIKKHLNARKISFASRETATSLTKMEYGGIAPFGLPDNWLVLVDSKVAASENIIIGSGLRGSKILTSGSVLAEHRGVEVLDLAV